MEHEIIVEKLSAFRDGALPPAERDLVAGHLEECPSCAAVLRDWEALAGLLFRPSSAPTSFQTEAFVARVMSRLPSDERLPFARMGRWLVPAAGLGFAALAFSFGSYSRDQGLEPAAALLSGGGGRVDLGDWLARPGAPAPDDLYALNSEDR
jgi:anti-sigma factor RsiW